MDNSALSQPEETEALSGVTVAACVILGLSFLVGMPGNLVVIWTILRHIKKRSHTVLLILHLAVADLLVLVTLPVWIYSLAHSWVFGRAACKAMVYLITSCMYSSVFLITVMSLERFVAIRYPFASITWKKKQFLNRVLFVIWAVAFLFGIPVIPIQELLVEDGRDHCLAGSYSSESQEVACRLLETLVGFAIPFSVLLFCYSCLWCRITQMTYKSKRKSSVLITSVVVVFAVCWIPHHVGNVMSIIGIALPDANRLEAVRENMVIVAGALVFISSTVNPLLYVFAARKFRSSLRDTGIQKLFRHISSSAPGEGGKELSFVSKRQRPSQAETATCTTDSKVEIEVPLNVDENSSSQPTA